MAANSTPTLLHDFGISVEVPGGWDGIIYRRDDPNAFPIAHLANFPLATNDGDFGQASVDTMPTGGILIVLAEYGPSYVGTPNFSYSGIPVPAAADFFPARLIRALPGQAGGQWFFTVNGRAFMLFVILAGWPNIGGLVQQLLPVLKSVAIDHA